MAENPLDTLLFGITRGFAEARGKQKLADIKAERPVRESPLDGIFGAINRTYTDPRTPDQALRALEINLANEQRKLSQQTAADKLLFDIQKVRAEQKDSVLTSEYVNAISELGALGDIDGILNYPVPEKASPLAQGRIINAREAVLDDLNMKERQKRIVEINEVNEIWALMNPGRDPGSEPFRVRKEQVDNEFKRRAAVATPSKVDVLLAQRKAALDAGDIATVASKEKELATALRDSNLRVETNADGGMVVTTGGERESLLLDGQTPSIAAVTTAIKDTANRSAALAVIDDAIRLIEENPGALGIPGKLTDVVQNKILAQLLPEAFNKEVATSRAALGIVRQAVAKAIAADSRISDRDMNQLNKEVLPSLDVVESAPNALSKLRQIRTVIGGKLSLSKDILGLPIDPRIRNFALEQVSPEDRALYEQSLNQQATAGQAGSVRTSPSGITYRVIN